jgi:hypothetical protein
MMHEGFAGSAKGKKTFSIHKPCCYTYINTNINKTYEAQKEDGKREKAAFSFFISGKI